MRKKKFFKILFASSLMSAMLIQNVWAGNVNDTALPSQWISYSLKTSVNTVRRDKEDATSHYIRNDSGFNLWVISRVNSSINTTVGGHAVVQSGKWRIRNLVKEKGYSSCYLNISAATQGVSGTARGVWSPDCAGSYNAAN